MAYYLNEYITTRKYGGPEEGDWWYDAGHFVKCHGMHDDREQSKNALVDIRKTYLDEAQRGVSKPGTVECTNTGLVALSRYPDIKIEKHEGRSYPARKPVYC